MGGGESAEVTLPPSFQELLTTDIQVNDPMCKTILTSQILSHQILDSPIINDLISKKPNNVQVLVFHMIFSIYKISKTNRNSDISKSLLISCFNSYLLLQHFHSFCIDSWFCWSPPPQIPGSLPSVFFIASLALLNHPLILQIVQRNSIYYHIKYEMIATIIMFLLSSPQPSADHFPNMHFECLDEADPFPLFQFLLSYNEGDELHRMALIVASNGIAFCPNWQAAFASLNFSTVCPLFQTLLKIPEDSQLLLVDSSSPGIFHELVTFFYQTLLRHDEALDSLPKGKEFIVSLLLPLQLMNERDHPSYFHSLVFSTLVLLTSDPKICDTLNQPFTAAFPCKASMHRGTYADLLIEILTMTVSDMTATAPLLPAACCILHNISAHISNFSYFSCHRIFRFLQMMAESRDRQVPKLIPIVVGAFEQILFQQFEKNTNIIIFMIRNMKLFRQLRLKNIDVHYIETFAKCFKEKAKSMTLGRMGADEAEIVLKKMKPNMFMKDYELPGPRSHVFTGEMAELWIDWMRTLAMRGGAFLTLQSVSLL
ncbi:hypothetical protein TRFO_16167 [Tritrichomonas foetus]|uniref:Dymeclin n=1 Tax=Tritrichomonas foetus TaxID=1144522 RepID=A0A1J4KVS9_9EUKA|nr:hypothetical protein TRFO_16167 [Tritrichomonas foetus]|eukprot:OHT13621.1 hypothetical protein TRFO_16167 [Tritrichomonas foetus]